MPVLLVFVCILDVPRSVGRGNLNLPVAAAISLLVVNTVAARNLLLASCTGLINLIFASVSRVLVRYYCVFYILSASL